MTIVEALKREDIFNLYLSYDDRWLYWDVDINEWVVLEHKPYMRSNGCLYQGKDEEAAVEALLNG